MKDCVAELFIAFARDVSQSLHQRLRFADHQLGDDFVVQTCEQIAITSKVAAVEQRDSELNIGGIEAVAFLQNARGRTYLQTQVPQTL
jgi:hypothetical protein